MKLKYRPIPQDLIDAVYYNNGGVLWKEDVKGKGRWSPARNKGKKDTSIKPKHWDNKRKKRSPAGTIQGRRV